jgi:heat shock protein HslJ
MKRNILFIISIISVFMALNSCKSKQKASTGLVYIGDNARNNFDWAGTYVGIIPCADCEGIQTRITLNKDGSYSMSQKYGDKDGLFEQKGNIRWSALGNTMALSDLNNTNPVNYKVGENEITMLDSEGYEIKGTLANNYILAKVNPLLTGKRWKLVELGGKKIEGQEAFIKIDAKSNAVSGNLGCNGFSGFYELKTGNRIKFLNLAVTQKMCLDMNTEDELKKALDIADNYTVSENSLILNRARMASLAKFVPAK